MRFMEIVLRDIVSSDAKDIYFHLQDGRVGAFLCDLPTPYSLNDAEDYIKLIYAKDSPFLHTKAITLAPDTRLIGTIGLKNPGFIISEAELGYWIAAPHWGKGIITETIRKFMEDCFHTLPFERYYADVFEKNIASVKALLRNGFLYAGEKEIKPCNKKKEDKILRFVREH